MSSAQLEALKEYVSALEVENQSKTAENVILYREINALTVELGKMEPFYLLFRRQTQETEALAAQLQLKTDECSQLMLQLKGMQI